MSRPHVQVKETSIASATLYQAAGKIVYVVESVQGEVFKFLPINSKDDLVKTLGIPTVNSSLKVKQDFFTVDTMLSYGNDIEVIRVVDKATAQMPRIGLDFSQTDPVSPLTQSDDTVFYTDFNSVAVNGRDIEIFGKSPTSSTDVKISIFAPLDPAQTGTLEWPAETSTTGSSTGYKWNDLFEYGPKYSKSEIAIVVFENNLVVEKFIVSIEDGQKDDLGKDSYIKDVLIKNSTYINAAVSAGSTIDDFISTNEVTLIDGTPGGVAGFSEIEEGYLMFQDKNAITFDYIIDGNNNLNLDVSSADIRTTIINEIVNKRKDCIAFINTVYDSIFIDNVPIADTDTIKDNIIADMKVLPNSTWHLKYSNYKKAYDKYNDKSIWIPITASVAGNKVKLNLNSEVWTPAAGNINGALTDVSELAYQPTHLQEDELYKWAINQVIYKPGKGFIINGQKTATDQNIGVSRLNVREVFRIAEVYIASVADDVLHTENNAINRARFKGICDAFLNDIKNRGGIERFKVICDTSNNTPDVINSYGFRASILIAGYRVAEQIVLEFYDTPQGVSFDEIFG